MRDEATTARPFGRSEYEMRIDGREKSVTEIGCRHYRARFASTGKPAFLNSLINFSFQPPESSIRI